MSIAKQTQDITRHRPLGDRVVIEPIEDSEYTTASGIVLVEHNPELRFGKVLAVGPGDYYAGAFRSTTVQPGDIISFFPHRAGESLHVGGCRYNILREATDVVSIITV